MKTWKYLFGIMFLVLSLGILTLFSLPDDNLHIIACDVGLGDGILVTYKNIQIVTDGGPDASILSCLGNHIPFWDKDIELLILSHPDADHATGAVSVLKNYKVGTILINPIDPGTQVYDLLESEVGRGAVPVMNPVEGMVLRVGLIRLDIVSPSRELLDRLSVTNEGSNLSKYTEIKETNLHSIVYRLSLGKIHALFPGDMPPEVSDSLSQKLSGQHMDYIKTPHHGSVNGLTENLLKVVMPKVAVISVGKNQWGFPKKEILDMLDKYGVRTLRTDELGDIKVVTDGEKVWIED